MEKEKIRCQVITPMFCYGADGQTPELRVPSLKGALRFWWRAIHPNLSLNEVKTKETEIFGGAGDNEAKKSSFLLQITNVKKNVQKISALPHKERSHRPKSITPNSTFNIIIRPESEVIKNLLLLTSIIGGIGARSRRGFGCFQIESIDDKEFNWDLNEDKLIEKINEINPNFEIGKEYERDYPYLQNVGIGNFFSDYNELLKKIGRASHEFDTPYTGTARNGRYASPIYVSVYKQNDKYYPIISTLKRTINNANDHQAEEKKKNDFIEAILGGA